jgi:large subunit ribosomal protein L24
MKVKKGDIVKIIVGKDRGRQGRVMKVLPDKKQVVVEGMNVYKKHIRGDGKERESAIVDIVKPMDVSNVMVVCEACGEPTRIGIKRVDGKKVRICKKCDKPVSSTGEESKDSKKNKNEDSKSEKKEKTKKKTTKKNSEKSKPRKSKSKKDKK